MKRVKTIKKTAKVSTHARVVKTKKLGLMTQCEEVIIRIFGKNGRIYE